MLRFSLYVRKRGSVSESERERGKRRKRDREAADGVQMFDSMIKKQMIKG